MFSLCFFSGINRLQFCMQLYQCLHIDRFCLCNLQKWFHISPWVNINHLAIFLGVLDDQNPGTIRHRLHDTSSQTATDLIPPCLPPFFHLASQRCCLSSLPMACHCRVSWIKFLCPCCSLFLLRVVSLVPRKSSSVEEKPDAVTNISIFDRLCTSQHRLRISQLLRIQHSVWYHNDLSLL